MLVSVRFCRTTLVIGFDLEMSVNGTANEWGRTSGVYYSGPTFHILPFAEEMRYVPLLVLDGNLSIITGNMRAFSGRKKPGCISTHIQHGSSQLLKDGSLERGQRAE